VFLRHPDWPVCCGPRHALQETTPINSIMVVIVQDLVSLLIRAALGLAPSSRTAGRLFFSGRGENASFLFVKKGKKREQNHPSGG